MSYRIPEEYKIRQRNPEGDELLYRHVFATSEEGEPGHFHDGRFENGIWQCHMCVNCDKLFADSEVVWWWDISRKRNKKDSKFKRPNVGDRVKWSYKAGLRGKVLTREGIVVYSGPESYGPRPGSPRWHLYNQYPEEVITAPRSNISFTSVSSGLIVKVEVGERTKYYAPWTKNLEVIS